MPRSKGTGKLERSTFTTETSKRSLKIEIDPDLRKHLRSLGAQERKQVGLVIDRVAAAFGQPHLHAGSGVRKLSETYFECRAGLALRLVFKLIEGNCLHFVLMGNHNEIQRFLKSNR